MAEMDSNRQKGKKRCSRIEQERVGESGRYPDMAEKQAANGVREVLIRLARLARPPLKVDRSNGSKVIVGFRQNRVLRMVRSISRAARTRLNRNALSSIRVTRRWF
jgi:hypothetical protein